MPTIADLKTRIAEIMAELNSNGTVKKGIHGLSTGSTASEVTALLAYLQFQVALATAPANPAADAVAKATDPATSGTTSAQRSNRGQNGLN